MRIATETLAAINAALEVDQGAQYRQLLKEILPTISDAYRGLSDGPRRYLGSSVIGDSCARKLFYSFRGASEAPTVEGRIVRLFNRGHLEEGRILALLRLAGVQVWAQDEEGRQIGFKSLGGHYRGHADGVVEGLPELPETPAVLEIKTHSLASFDKLVKAGVRSAKPVHFAQMQDYMREFELKFALYVASCKDDERLHLEIVAFDPGYARLMKTKAQAIVFAKSPPNGVGSDATWFECKFCEHKAVCHRDAAPLKDCRNCSQSAPLKDGSWVCHTHGSVLTDFSSCTHYARAF